MGQKRIKTVDLSQKKTQKKASVKTKKTEEKVKEPKKTSLKKEPVKKGGGRGKKRIHSRRYRQLKTKINRQKLYSLDQAVNLLLKLINSQIDETIEIHLSSKKEKFQGRVKFPYSTGKDQKVAIATQKLIDRLSKGNIDFDILIASPKIMPQLARVAKILGPKRLMPNPKAGTITDQPEKLKKKLETEGIRFRTEAKAPLIHLTLGKASLGKRKILANLKALIKAVGPKNIQKAFLTATHSPSIKLKIDAD